MMHRQTLFSKFSIYDIFENTWRQKDLQPLLSVEREMPQNHRSRGRAIRINKMNAASVAKCEYVGQ
jgi:hypothetical protein